MKNIFDRLVELKGTQSTAAFARSINTPQQTMDRYLKGRDPTIEVIRQLCLVYKVSADWLLGLTDNQRGSQQPVNAPNNKGAIAIGGGNAVNRDCMECPLLQAHLKKFSRAK